MSSGKGVGARLARKEDARYLHGRGEFVADIQLPGTLDVAFVRSPVAHARVRAVGKPSGREANVFTAPDLARVKPIVARSGLPGFKVSEQPVLAAERVRYVGELLAACVAPGRAEAEDLAEAVTLDLEELPAISDALRAGDPEAPLLHEHWGDNCFLESFVDADLSDFESRAAVSVSRTFRTARQCMAPIEGRGVLAYWDRRLEMLVMYTSCQMPHIIRTGLSECLGLAQEQVRVVAPDVGGGFGYKGILLPEEVCLGFIALGCGHPVRWIEDRREQLSANANCREHHYRITGHAAADGTLLAIDCEAHVDAGAYSAYPFSACLEAAQVASILPGPYDFPGYRCRTWSVASNKPPILPYRGVARTGVCFALEVLLDAMARELGMDPVAFRAKNLVKPQQMPFDNITNKHFDSGDYPQCLQRAAVAIGLDAVRARQSAGEADGRRIGVGFSIFCEQAAHGTSVYAAWGVPMIPGHEQATVRMTPSGGLEVRVGVHSHGQGLETTLAQVAHEVLGVDPERVKVLHGDTAHTPYSTGTWGSRCMVMAGGAVAAACDVLGARIRRLGAHLLQVGFEQVTLGAGQVHGPNGQVSLAEVARLWYLEPENLPDDADARGLEATEGYKTVVDSGTFSYACHACVVALDTDTGEVELLDYVVVEDGGVLVNPSIVEGQIHGGTAQGIGTALYEEMPFDHRAQPLASTLADYHLPGASEVPTVRIEHMETPSPYSRFGQKGIGEGGAIGPPAAIANAINDALSDLGVEVNETPITMERVLDENHAGEPGHLMKAAAFDYLKAADSCDAVKLLGQASGHARPIAGGQSLGPMLNLRLARPDLLVDIRACSDLRGYVDEGDAIVYGAALTHAELEDARVPDAAGGWIAHAARRIAYRAIRNRGTLGGSLAHADPAADWLTVMLALDADVVVRGPHGLRAMALERFVRGPFSNALGPAEILVGVRVRKRERGLRFGYSKLSVKCGEFARAFAVTVQDRERDACRAVVGAIERVPLVIDDAGELTGDPTRARALIAERVPRLQGAALQIHACTLARAARAMSEGMHPA